MPPNVIKLAFAIYRSCFIESGDLDNYFTFLASSFINRRFITPDSEMIGFKGGIPSGAVETSIIGTLCS